jgi:carbamoylphosphate synthase small subunit
MDPYGMFVFGGIATQRYFEGSKIFPVAVVVSEYSFVASHYSAVKSLSQWLEE